MIRLDKLQPGTRFSLGDVTGELVAVNDCRATVRLDCDKRRTFETASGDVVQIRQTTRVTDWAPGTEVVTATDTRDDAERAAQEGKQPC